MDKLQLILKGEAEKETLKKYNEHKSLFYAVKTFLVKKKRVLYGGTALNEILPKDKKFYPKEQLPDYDVFTPTPKKDAIELGKYLQKKGYQYISIKKGFWHKGTFKVYAEFQPVVDLTYIRPKFYKFLLKESRKNPVENQSDPGLKVSPPVILFWAFYQELSKPRGSLHRLQKVFGRFKIFQKEFKIEKEKETTFSLEQIPSEHLIYLEGIRDYVKKNQIAFVGGFAVGLQLGKNRRNKIDCCSIPGIPVFDILSGDMRATLQDLRKILPEFNLEKIEPYHLIEIMPARYILKSKDGNQEFARILDASTGCYSTDKICGYNVGNLDTILNYLYSQLINNMFFKTTIHGIAAKEYTKAIIQALEKENNKKTIRERFHLRCWGKERTKEDVLKEQWRNKNKIFIDL